MRYKKYLEFFEDPSIRNIHERMGEMVSDDDPNLMEKLFPHVVSGGRWGKILFLRLMKEREEKSGLNYIRKFLDDRDEVVNLLQPMLWSALKFRGRRNYS